MSKNLTRKGLVLGTVAALGASLFAGTPATAAPTALYLDTAFGTSGTSQVGVLGQYFTLASTVQGGSNNDVVEYFVEGATAANITATGRFVTDLTSVAYSPTQYTATTVRAIDNDAKTASFESAAWVAGNTYQFGIQLNKTNITTTTSIKVTPFLDSVNNDNKPGANELTGTPVTINFIKASELTATPSLTTVTAGSVVKAAVALSGSVNTSQLRSTTDGAPSSSDLVTVDFKELGADWGANTGVAARWSITDGVIRAVTAADTATASRGYGATAKLYAVASASADVVVAATGTVASLDSVSVASGTSYRLSANSSSNVVRAGSGAITAKTKVTAVSGKSVAGAKVTFTITEESAASLPIGATLTAGGKTLTAASSSKTEEITVDVTSAADGSVSLPITYTGVTDGKKFRVSAAATAANGAATGGTYIELTGQDSAAASVVDELQSANANVVRVVARNAAFSYGLKIVDQFGQVPTGSFRFVQTTTGTAAVASPIAVTSGAATITGTDSSTADGSYSVTATLQRLGTDGTTWAAVGSLAVNTAFTIGTAKTAATITLAQGATTALVRNGKALVAGNSTLEQDTIARTVAGGSSISATITDRTGANVAGAPVTFTAAGVLFKAGSVYGLGSITVYTGTNGQTGDVNVYSNIVGDVTVNVTSGAATAATKKFTFAAPTSGGTTWTVTAPVSVLPGATLKYSAKLTDEFGAAVDTTLSVVRITYTGPGYVTATLPTDTDKDGIVSFTVLLGAGDTGSATVKLEYANTNGFEETVDNDDVVKTSTIIIGNAPATAATSAVSGSTGKFFVSVTNAAAKKVVVKVAGKFFRSFTGTAAKKSVALKAPKGKHKVTVFVGGKLTTTKTITVK
jgi:hypothetical protein